MITYIFIPKDIGEYFKDFHPVYNNGYASINLTHIPNFKQYDVYNFLFNSRIPFTISIMYLGGHGNPLYIRTGYIYRFDESVNSCVINDFNFGLLIQYSMDNPLTETELYNIQYNILMDLI